MEYIKNKITITQRCLLIIQYSKYNIITYFNVTIIQYKYKLKKIKTSCINVF